MNKLSFVEKRKIFIVFNRACAKARTHAEAQHILERLYKALGIIQHHDYYEAEKAIYNPTRSHCNCKDWEFHNATRRKYTGPCKHMAAEILLERVSVITYHQLSF